MKKVKKLFLTVALLTILAILAVPFAGCSGDDSVSLPPQTKNGEWFEVQSITCTGSSISTLESKCYIEIDKEEEVSKSEYDNASEDQKSVYISSDRIDLKDLTIYFYSNRTSYLSTLKKWINKPYYTTDERYDNQTDTTSTKYFKHTLKNYELYYVRVRLLDNNSLEINYNDYNVNQFRKPESYNNTIRVLPLSYTITYFND